MTHPVLYFLGVISFSIYLLHAPFRPVWAGLVRMVHPDPLPGPVAILLVLAGAAFIVPIAWIGYVLVEHPGRGLIRAMASRLGRGGRVRAVPPRPAR